MKKVIIKTVCLVCMLGLFNSVNAQSTNEKTKSPTVVLWDGMAVAGYVNEGGFVNFGGPTIKFDKKTSESWIRYSANHAYQKR